MLLYSIIRRHNHVNALALAGLAVENGGFPAVINCPFCEETALYVYDDVVRDDIWLSCDNCSAHGNIITFAAQIWKLDIPAAVARFMAAGIGTGINENDQLAQLIRRHGRQTAAFEFWQAASGQLWSHSDDIIEHKLREFGVSKDIPCHGLLGLAYDEQIVALCSGVGRAYPKHLRPKTPALVFPYYNLPGRFAGFLLARYGEEFEIKRAFVPLAGNKNIRPDAGYYLLNTAMLPPHPVLKNAYFVVDDPVWALKAQTTQLRHGNQLLPLCAAYNGPEAHSHGTGWHGIPPARRFFYGRTVTPEIISQAAACRGYVCPAPPENAVHPPMPARTVKRLAAICKTAITWQTALIDVFNTTNLPSAQAFAARLNISRERLQQFFAEKTTVPADIVSQIMTKVQPHNNLAPDKNAKADIIERSGGWYTPSGMCIINCLPVIRRVIYTDDEQKYYDGYVKKNDKIYEFFENAARIEKLGLLGFVEQLLAPHKELVITAGQWNSRAVSTALRLHPPDVVNVSNTPGWNDKTREFQFAKYALSNDGEIVLPVCPQLKTNKQLDFPEPCGTAPITIYELLTPSHENAFIWALTATGVTQLIAPIVQRDWQSVMVGKSYFNPVLNLCTALNYDISAASKAYNVNLYKLSAAIRRSICPTLFEPTALRDKILASVIAKYPNYPITLKLHDDAIVSALSYGWAAISPIALPPVTVDYAALRYIIPAYVQRVMRNRLTLAAADESLTVGILKDLHAWLNETHGQTFNLAAAEQVLELPQHAHLALMRVLNKLIAADKIAVLPRPRNRNQSGNYVIRNKEHWWLNRKALDCYFSRIGVVPNWNALINCFMKNGVFKGEELIYNMSGLLVESAWCDQFWDDYNEAKDVG